MRKAPCLSRLWRQPVLWDACRLRTNHFDPDPMAIQFDQKVWSMARGSHRYPGSQQFVAKQGLGQPLPIARVDPGAQLGSEVCITEVAFKVLDTHVTDKGPHRNGTLERTRIARVKMRFDELRPSRIRASRAWSAPTGIS